MFWYFCLRDQVFVDLAKQLLQHMAIKHYSHLRTHTTTQAHTHTYIHTNVFNGIEMYLNMRFSVLYAKKFPFAHNSVAQTV